MTAKLATANEQLLAVWEAVNILDGSRTPGAVSDHPPADGMQFDSGYLSADFVTDPQLMEFAFENV